MFKTLFSACLATIAWSLSAQTFTSTVNQPIPDDGSTVTFDIAVSGLPSAIDTTFGLEMVCLNMTHTYTEDMTIKLQAPNGKIVVLIMGAGGAGHDFSNTCLAGTGASMAASAAPFSGTFQSRGTLGDLNKGQDPNGTWTLICHDTYAFADAGFLQDWSITFGPNPAKPFIFRSSNLPIVKLTTLGQPIDNEPKVPVLMQIIDNGPGQRNDANQTTFAYEGRIMAEWQGFTGPYYPKKNYDFETVDAAGENLDTSLLGLPSENDWLFKAEFLDHTLIKNAVTYEMARRMGGYAPRTRPCELILDGEYIGLYVLTEQVKRDANRVDIAKLASDDISGAELTGGYIIEMNINNNAPGDWNSPHQPINFASCQLPVEFKHVYPKRNEIMPQQRDYIRAFVDSFETSLLLPDFANPDAGYRQFIDVQTFIDFLIVNEFSVNYDSYGRSTYLYKEKITDGGKLKCGPPWDYDRAYDYNVPQSTEGWVWEITHPGWPFPFWWSRLWQDEAYRKQLACRWTMLRQNTLSDAAFAGLIDSMSGQIHEAQQRNFTIWNDLGARTYDENVDSLHNYVARRLRWIDATLAAEGVAAPQFYLPTDTVLCAGEVFDAALLIGQQYEYNWQPGPDEASFVFPQNGAYNLLVTDANGCFSRKTMQVALAEPLDAGFSSQQVGGSSTWVFTPNKPDADSYFWDFGDGSTSTQASPTHQFGALGVYIVSLTVADLPGCPPETVRDTVQFLSAAAEPLPFGGAVYPNPFQAEIQVDFAQPLAEGCSISLENVWGQTLFSGQLSAGTARCVIPAAHFPAGVYLLQIAQKDRVWGVKMVRE